LKFFNEIKDNTQEAQKRLEKKRKLRTEKTNQLRAITDNIQALASNINKNVEILQ
jgi:hypothetical protein